MEARTKQKIAILGGGPAGLTAAFHLSQSPDFEITVYQMGWRVGGKGTSGYRRWTPPDGSGPIWNRIEEHGLHILFGSYERFFSVMRKCYEGLKRPDEHPLATVEKAFEPRDFGSIMYRHRSRWKTAHVWFRRNELRPGMGERIDDGDFITRLASFLSNSFRNAFSLNANPNARRPSLGQRIFDLAGRVLFAFLTRTLHRFAENPLRGERILRTWQTRLARPTRAILGWFGRGYLLWLGIDYFVALLIGMLRAGLVKKNQGRYEDLDDLDFREWLALNGVHAETAASPFVSMIYHAAFSYECGDPARPRIAAGSALRVILHAATERRGSAYNRMRGGMGEVVFVPLLQTLRRRGVKFEFFHKVEALRLDPSQTRVDQIEILRQARLVPGLSEYDPLIQVNNVEAFPSEPLWEQLERGNELRGRRFDSYYESSFPTGDPLTLRRGHDFDYVVLATPIATLPHVAIDLIQASERWQEMVARVKSIQTVSVQIWFDESHHALGWNMPDRCDPHTLLSMYAMPLSTWAPMDQTLPRENWPPGMAPSAVSYLTGAQSGPDVAPPPHVQPDFPERQTEKARALAEAFVQNQLAEDLLEKLEDTSNPPFPRFAALHDPEGRCGSARLFAQYIRSNSEPSERCTLALPGATRARMKAGETGFQNLVIAGDWIDNGLLLACMEGAFAGGLQAGEAIESIVRAPAGVTG